MSWIDDYAANYINKMPAVSDFSKLFPYSQFFDPQLAQAGAMQRAEGYYLPLLEKNIDAIRGDYADRGLFRSGMRGYGEEQTMMDVADAQQQMVDQLAAQREKEAMDRYALLQAQYEANPTGYTPPADLQRAQPGAVADRGLFGPDTWGTTQTQPAAQTQTAQAAPTDYYGYRKAMYGNKPTVGYKYGIGTEENAPYKYGQSYKSWWENKFKKPY